MVLKAGRARAAWQGEGRRPPAPGGAGPPAAGEVARPAARPERGDALALGEVPLSPPPSPQPRTLREEPGTTSALPSPAAPGGRGVLSMPRMPPRIACIHLPLFPLAARLRSEPELVREALVVTEGNGNAARVVAATRLARGAGIKPGLTLPQARALCPKLVARPRDEECERAAQEALLEVAESFSPRVEDAREGVAYLDVEGLERHLQGSIARAGAGALPGRRRGQGGPAGAGGDRVEQARGAGRGGPPGLAGDRARRRRGGVPGAAPPGPPGARGRDRLDPGAAGACARSAISPASPRSGWRAGSAALGRELHATARGHRFPAADPARAAAGLPARA